LELKKEYLENEMKVLEKEKKLNNEIMVSLKSK